MGSDPHWTRGSAPRRVGRWQAPATSAIERLPVPGLRPPILRVKMRRKDLLTQVLFANLLLIVAAVVVTWIAGKSASLDVSEAPGWR